MVKKWLKGRLKYTEDEVDQLYNSRTVLEFLMVWSIFESECFGGNMKKGCIDAFVQNQCSEALCGLLKEEYEYFHGRYQSPTLYQLLTHRDRFCKAEDILDLSSQDVDVPDRLAFLIYVVYRYRNNMFHGNKKLKDWREYERQIGFCVSIMTKIGDDVDGAGEHS